MFNFFGRDKKTEPPPPLPQPDALNEVATQIAIELIEGKGGKVYLNGMKRMFKASPRMIDDVAPEYQELLKEVLEKDDFCN